MNAGLPGLRGRYRGGVDADDDVVVRDPRDAGDHQHQGHDEPGREDRPRGGVDELLLGLRLGHHCSWVICRRLDRGASVVVMTHGARRRARGGRRTSASATHRLAGRDARSWSSSAVGLCSRSAPPTARAPTCARAATPTWPRWSATEADQYASPRGPGRTSSTDEVEPLSQLGQEPRGPALPPPGRGAARTPRDSPRAPARASRSPSPTPPRTSHQRLDRGPQPARGPPAGHPGRGQRDVERRGRARSPSRASGSSAPPASSARATRCSSQGVPYAQPYVIQAVGDPARAAGGHRRQRLPRRLPRAGGRPRHRASAGPSSEEAEVTAPAYDGLLDLSYARPLR